MPCIGDISGREDIRPGALELGVYHDAVVDLESRVGGELRARHHAPDGSNAVFHGESGSWSSGARRLDQAEDAWFKNGRQIADFLPRRILSSCPWRRRGR
jgi:hypothetical protein